MTISWARDDGGDVIDNVAAVVPRPTMEARMVSPFPGMDPYLEAKEIWAGFHHLLADEIMAQLNAKLSPKYYADVDVRTVLQEVGVSETHIIYPDAAVLEVPPAEGATETAVAIAPAPIKRPAVLPDQWKLRTVQVYVTETQWLVTSLEVLSPVNKRGSGLQAYREKRRRILQSDVHLIELDLLRGGERPGWEVNAPPIDADYILLINRAGEGDVRISEIWPVHLNQSLPVLPVPLLFPDPDVPLDLGEALRNVYTRAVYARRIDYRQPLPAPEIRPAMAQWLATMGRMKDEG